MAPVTWHASGNSNANLSRRLHLPPEWIVMADCIVGVVGQPSGLVDHVLLHAAQGMALVDVAPSRPAPESLAMLQAMLDRAQFRAIFGAYPPIVYLHLSASELPDLPRLLDEAFAALPPLALPGGQSWLGSPMRLLSAPRSLGNSAPEATAETPNRSAEHHDPAVARQASGAMAEATSPLRRMVWPLVVAGVAAAAVLTGLTWLPDPLQAPGPVAATVPAGVARATGPEAVAAPLMMKAPEPAIQLASVAGPAVQQVANADMAPVVTEAVPAFASEIHIFEPLPSEPLPHDLPWQQLPEPAEAPATLALLPPTLVPAPLPPRALPAPRLLDAPLLAAMLRRGEELLALGDLSAARAIHRRAAEAGSATAAMALAASYDPDRLPPELQRSADRDRARQWYLVAEELRASGAEPLARLPAGTPP